MADISREATTSNRGRPIDREAINRARVARNWSITGLAEIAGISIAAASRACSGKPVARETIRKVALAFEAHEPNDAVNRLLRGEIDDPARTGAA